MERDLEKKSFEDLLDLNPQMVDLEEKDMSMEAIQTRSTKAIIAIPGDVAEDGSYVDAYGVKHYSYGASYKIAKGDKRLTANGAYAGKQLRQQFTDEELDANPFLGLEPRDFQTVTLYMRGLSRRQIADELEVCEQTITTRLSKPKVKRCLAEMKVSQEEDLHGLVGEATEALRDGLSVDQKIHVRLAAARDVLKVTGHTDKKVDSTGEETATTQMQKVLQMLNVNVTVNN